MPGVSGNPNGRRPIPPEVREAARALGLEAIERLAYWMRSDDPQASIPAAKILLERGFGKSAILIGTEGRPLVNINFGAGQPIRDVHSAAEAYKAICGDPAFDFSSVSFAAPEPANAEIVSQAIEAMPPDPDATPGDDKVQERWSP